MRRVNHSGAYGAAHRRERGVVAIMVALAMVLLFGFAALALDLGKLYIVRSELSNAADSCALAAARDLTGAVSLATSEAAGITVGAANKMLLQSQNVSLSVNKNVTYSKTFTGAYQTKDKYTSADLPSIGYVRCTVVQAGVNNWFMRVISSALGTSAVAATAVASTTQAQTTCALPMYVCQPPGPASFNIYDWLCSKTGPGSPPPCDKNAGNFGWIDIGQGNSASATAKLFSGYGQCNLPLSNTLTTNPGLKNNVPDAYNTRFGIYAGGLYKGPDDGPPDFTGYAYTSDWVAAGNTQQTSFADFLKQRLKSSPYQGDNAAGVFTQTPSQPAASIYTHGADRRLAIIPVVSNCSGVTGTSSVNVSSWACVLLLHPMTTNSTKDTIAPSPMNGWTMIQYLGAASATGSPCATQGIPGTTSLAIGPKVPVLVQ